MKELMTEWRKYFIKEQVKQKRNFLFYNADYILNTVENSQNKNLIRYNLTGSTLYNFFSTAKDFVDFLIKNNLDKILKLYEIEELLGHGAVGLVFSLKEPHENYVLKLQITPSKHVHADVGVEYPEELYKKQEQDKFNKNELRVLDSVTGKNLNPPNYGGQSLQGSRKQLTCYMFVYSKITQDMYAGRTGKFINTEDANEDTKPVRETLRILSDQFTSRNDKIHELMNKFCMSQDYTLSTQTKNSRSAGMAIAKNIVDMYYNHKDKKRIRKIAEYLYTYIDHQFKQTKVSKSQFANIAEEYYKQLERAGYGMLDFHGGNWGIMKNTDTPISFDV